MSLDIDGLEKRTEEKRALIENNIKKHKEVLNRLFDSEDGKFLYKVMVKYSKLFSIDKGNDLATIKETLGKQKMILELILPYLDRDVRRGLHD
jgi:hypothetical protein